MLPLPFWLYKLGVVKQRSQGWTGTLSKHSDPPLFTSSSHTPLRDGGRLLLHRHIFLRQWLQCPCKDFIYCSNLLAFSPAHLVSSCTHPTSPYPKSQCHEVGLRCKMSSPVWIYFCHLPASHRLQNLTMRSVLHTIVRTLVLVGYCCHCCSHFWFSDLAKVHTFGFAVYLEQNLDMWAIGAWALEYRCTTVQVHNCTTV